MGRGWVGAGGWEEQRHQEAAVEPSAQVHSRGPRSGQPRQEREAPPCPHPGSRPPRVAEQPSCIMETCVRPTPCPQETPTKTRRTGSALEPPGLLPPGGCPAAEPGRELSGRSGRPGEGTRDRKAGERLPARRAPALDVSAGGTPVRVGSLPVAGLAVDSVWEALCAAVGATCSRFTK